MPQPLAIIIELVAFILVVAGVVFAERRLAAGLNVRRRLQGEAAAAASPARHSVVRQSGVRNPMLAWVQGQTLNNPQEREQLRSNLTAAGFASPAAPALYVTIRFGLAIGLPLAFLFSQGLLPHPLKPAQLILLTLILSALGLIVPRLFIDNRASSRRANLEAEFPDALDLMVVCVEAGLALEASFIRVGEETAISHPRIAAEFRTLSQELAAGRSRADALRNMAERTHVAVVKSFVALLIQTDQLGVSIAQSLRTYSQEMRQHRMLRAEEKAMRIPVLLTLPLVGFILPVIITSVMLPAIIDVTRNVLPALTHVGKH
jgi:tight adherence protein C